MKNVWRGVDVNQLTFRTFKRDGNLPWMSAIGGDVADITVLLDLKSGRFAKLCYKICCFYCCANFVI